MIGFFGQLIGWLLNIWFVRLDSFCDPNLVISFLGITGAVAQLMWLIIKS